MEDKVTPSNRDSKEFKQIYSHLAHDDGLYLLPLGAKAASICKYLDFASIHVQPQKLSVVLDDSKSVTLGAIGNGAVT
jgi:hypothetical protein